MVSLKNKILKNKEHKKYSDHTHFRVHIYCVTLPGVVHYKGKCAQRLLLELTSPPVLKQKFHFKIYNTTALIYHWKIIFTIPDHGKCPLPSKRYTTFRTNNTYVSGEFVDMMLELDPNHNSDFKDSS